MKTHLLFADDSVTIRKVAELAFEGRNVEITTVGSGEEVLEKLKESVPDIIISDITMPGINGIELCRTIRENPDFKHIPILLLKNESNSGINEMEIEMAGADATLAKPFKSEELIHQVQVLTSDNGEEPHPLEIPPDVPPITDLENEMISELQGQENFLNLRPKNEVKSDSEGLEPDPMVEVIAVDKEVVQDEEPDISGLLSEEEIHEQENEIQLKKRDIEELYESDDDDLSWIDGEETDDVEFFEKFQGGFNPRLKITSDLLPKEKIEEAFKDAVAQMVTDSSKKILEIQLEEFLKNITLQIVDAVEKAVWELVPDLAEKYIKKEIEKIKSGY